MIPKINSASPLCQRVRVVLRSGLGGALLLYAAEGLNGEMILLAHRLGLSAIALATAERTCPEQAKRVEGFATGFIWENPA